MGFHLYFTFWKFYLHFMINCFCCVVGTMGAMLIKYGRCIVLDVVFCCFYLFTTFEFPFKLTFSFMTQL